MDIFHLVATLGLDSSGFLTGLDIAGEAMQSFANMAISFGKDVMDTGMNFDAAMSSVQAVLGPAEGTMERMNELRAFALDQAKTSVFTAEETANAYYYMGMAGWKSEQMIAGLPAVMSLAAASGEDLAMVSDIVTDSLTAFGLTADDTQRYVDILAQAATNSNTNVRLMGETFKYVAPIAGALGADVEDVAVSIGLMANAGIKGSMAGTALRQIFTRISTDAGASEKQFGALGIITEVLGVQFRDATGKMRDWSDVIADVRVKWRDLSEEQQIAYAKQIASERGMSAWLAIMNASEEDVEKLTAAITEAGGAAQTMSEIRLDNLAGDITYMKSAFDILKVAIYDDVKGPMREVVQWATAAINDVTDAINENGLAGGIEVLGAKIEEAGEKFAPLMESIGKAAGPLVSAIFDSVLPRLAEAGSKLGEGLLKSLGDSMAGSGSPVSGLAGVFISTLGSGLSIVTTVSGWLAEAGTEGGKQAALNTAEQLIGMPQSELNAIEAKAAEWGKKWGTTTGDNMSAQMGTQIGSAAPSMRDGLATVLGAAGDAAGKSIANSIDGHISAHTYSINVRANVTGLPMQYNASAMDTGRIFTKATVFGYANDAFQVAGDAGPEAVVGVNSLRSMITGAVNNAMGSAAGREITVPRGGVENITVVVKLPDDTELGRAVYRMYNKESKRQGVQLAGVNA